MNHEKIYFYRGRCITRQFKGWWFDGDLRIYKTLQDAKNAINKYLDGTHKAEPRIIGEAELNDDYTWKFKETNDD